MSWPVRAEVRQCTLRSASPGSYARSAWNEMSLSVIVFVTSPSRSRTSPAADGCSLAVTGCTKSSTGSVQRTTRRSSPSWSPRTDTAGPATITARRLVGTANSSSCSSSGGDRRDDELGESRADRQFEP